jgi:hypothetical protein
VEKLRQDREKYSICALPLGAKGHLLWRDYYWEHMVGPGIVWVSERPGWEDQTLGSRTVNGIRGMCILWLSSWHLPCGTSCAWFLQSSILRVLHRLHGRHRIVFGEVQ